MTNATSSSSDEARVVDAVPTGLFIGGTWRPAASGRTLAVDDPATGKALCEVADAGPEDGMEALAAAAAAQPSFAAIAPRDRGEILGRAYELLMERIDDLALLMTLE
ncbi:MAG: aldehyde dehydrogenase family protein, partial [Pseudonocardia sp.]